MLKISLVLLSLLAVDPYTPTEQQLDERLNGVKREDGGRGYQRRSARKALGHWDRARAWIRDTLRRIHVTPAQALLGLGLVGVLYTWGKNKKLTRWMVLATFCWILMILGVAAMVFAWPWMN